MTSPLSIATTNDSYLTIACDSYTKQEVTNKISALVNSAPGLLDTLGEIASYLGSPTDTSTSLISLISTKANASETFYKSKVDNDVYLGIGNKRLISLATTVNKLIFEIQDSMGTLFSGSYYSALTFQMNTITKKQHVLFQIFLL